QLRDADRRLRAQESFGNHQKGLGAFDRLEAREQIAKRADRLVPASRALLRTVRRFRFDFLAALQESRASPSRRALALAVDDVVVDGEVAAQDRQRLGGRDVVLRREELGALLT